MSYKIERRIVPEARGAFVTIWLVERGHDGHVYEWWVDLNGGFGSLDTFMMMPFLGFWE